MSLTAEKSVQKIFNENETSKVVLDHLLNRQRSGNHINITRLRHDLIADNVKFYEVDFLNVFENLVKAGVATVVRGRRGKPSRLFFNYNLRSIAQMAMVGREAELEKILATHKKRAEEAAAKGIAKRAKAKPKKAAAKKATKKSAKAAAPTAKPKMQAQGEQTVLVPFGNGFAKVTVPANASLEEINALVRKRSKRASK